VAPVLEKIAFEIPTYGRTHTFSVEDIHMTDSARLSVEVTVSYSIDPYRVARRDPEQMLAWIEQNWITLIESKLYSVLGDVLGRYTQQELEQQGCLSDGVQEQIESQLAEAVGPWGVVLTEPEGVWLGPLRFVRTERRPGEAPVVRATEETEWPPVTFRQELVEQLMSRIQSGASCCILGTNGSGKGNLLTFLKRGHVKRHYLGDQADRFIFLLLGYGLLANNPGQSIFELALDCLCQDRGLLSVTSSEVHAYLRELHEQSTSPENHLGYFRYLDQGVGYLCTQWGLHIVFLIDEFEEFRKILDRESLFALRRLRDSNKGLVCYVLAMGDAHWAAETGLQECQDFCELFTHNVFGLSPYNQRDACILITRKAAEHNLKASRRDIALLMGTTGGHPGLLVAALPLVLGGRIDIQQNVLQQLIRNPEVRSACGKILKDLPDEEQQVLTYVAKGLLPDPTQKAALDTLRALMLVQDKGGTVVVSYPLLEAYLKEAA
jgi:DNA-binding NarL/FixJ family response regulator